MEIEIRYIVDLRFQNILIITPNYNTPPVHTEYLSRPWILNILP
jgi:hypothetical protein